MFCSQLEELDSIHFLSMSILSQVSKEAYASTITDLHEEFTQRFLDFSTQSYKFYVSAKPFSVTPEYSDVDTQMELVELQCDSTPQHHYYNNDLSGRLCSCTDQVFGSDGEHLYRYSSYLPWSNCSAVAMGGGRPLGSFDELLSMAFLTASWWMLLMADLQLVLLTGFTTRYC